MGTYTVQEDEAPAGYEKVDTVWTIELTKTDPTGGGTIHVTNTALKGSLKIVKNILPTSAATSGNLAGWQFKVYKNDPTYVTTIRDGVIYRVKVTDAEGNTIYSDNAELTVEPEEELPPIVITKQPENNAAAVGGKAPFTVEAHSTTGKTLTYQWYYIRKTDTKWSASTVGKGPTYTVEMYDSSYEYRRVKCLISDGTNEIWSDEADLYLPTSLGIKTNPKDTSSAYGSTATFSVTCYNTPTSYTWQYSADGSTWTNCSASAPFECKNYNTASLMVTSDKSIDGYQFRCVVKNSSQSVTSKAATLDAIPAYSYTTSPNYAITEIGNSASFYFGVTGGSISYQWQIKTSENGEWTDIEGATGSGVSLTMTEEYSNSKVRAVATQGDYVLYSKVITFATPDTTCITVQPSAVTGKAGEEVELSVKANGDGLVYQWEVSTDGGATWTMVNEQYGDTYTTDSTGIIQIDELPTGDYFVQEIDTGRENWIYDLAPKAVTVTENNTAELPFEVTITNELSSGGLLIQKVTEDGKNLARWKFGIYTDAACTQPAGVVVYSNYRGIYQFTDLAPGTYWVKELGHYNSTIEDLYYCASENPQMVEVQSGTTVRVYFQNKLKYGSLEIQKETNTDTQKGGWKFHVYSVAADGTRTEITGSPFTTPENGTLLIEKLLPGKYIVVEESNDSPYWICDVEEKETTVTAGQTSYVEVLNFVRGKLQIKKITTDGSSPERYQFNVYKPDGSLLSGSPFSPDSDGNIDVGYVAPGLYTVEEVLASDDAYEIVGDSRQTLEIKAEAVTTFTFTNAPKVGTLEITKETNTGADKDGWKVNVYRGSVAPENLLPGSPYETVDGKITIADLPIDTYIVVEVDDGKEMWIYDLEEKTVTVPHNGTGTVTITNTHLGYGKIIKTTTNGGTKAGWLFELRNANGDLLGTYETDSNGEYLIKDLLPGTYTVTEVGHKDMTPEQLAYWSMDAENTKTLVVEAGTTNSVTFNNQWLGKGGIKKDVVNSTIKAGWQFHVWTDTADLGIFTTDENGDIDLGLRDPGTYYVQETGHATIEDPSLWVMDTEVKTLVIEAGTIADVTIENRLQGGWSFEKIMADGSSAAGWQFDIEDSNGNVTSHFTDADGKIYLELEPGTYKVTEIIPADVMYEPQGSLSFEIVITAGEIRNDTLTNVQILGEITITKTDGNGDPVSGAGFVATDSKGNTYNFVESSTTPGLYVLTNIPIDKYTIEETVVPPGYQISGDNRWEVSLSKDHRTENLEIVNIEQGTAQIKKETTNGGVKAGWIFEIRNAANELVGTYTTNEEGTFTTGWLAPGTYTVTEIGHESGDYEYWIMDAESTKTLVIESGKTTAVTFKNIWLGKLSIRKNVNNSDVLAGWTGELYLVNADSTETKIGTYTSDANGEFTTLLVAPGKYIFRETGHNDSSMDLTYWVMSSDVAIEVNAGATTTATITNTQFGKGQLKKDTTNGGIKAGWIFEIKDAAGNVMDGTFITDGNGDLNLGPIAPGKYTVTEIGHKDMTADQLAYWIMDASVQTLVIEAGKTSSVSFTNRWLGKGQIIKTMADGTSPVGYQFEVIGPDGKPLSGSPFKITDESGVFFLGDLEPGKYTVREIVPEGSVYLPVGGAEKTLTVVAGETASVSYINALRSGEITINKVDGSDTDKALAGAKFLLEWLDNDVWTPVVYSDTVIPGGCSSMNLENGCLTTGEDGQIIFYGLHPDYEYRLTEIEAPNGYVLQAGSIFEGKLPADTLTADYTVYNHSEFELPSTGVTNHLMPLFIFAAIVVFVFAAMLVVAIKKGLLAEIFHDIRK